MNILLKLIQDSSETEILSISDNSRLKQMYLNKNLKILKFRKTKKKSERNQEEKIKLKFRLNNSIIPIHDDQRKFVFFFCSKS